MHTPHLRDLIDDAHSAWPLVTEWIGNARVAVEVLPSTSPNREATLLALDVTTRSALGAIAWKTGGILVDHGWLRLLGSGHPRLSGSLQTWMGGGNDAIDDPLASGLLVAHDAVGGFFAINGGGLPGALRNVCYFEPDTLRWSGLGTGYSGFLQWVVSGSLDAFYGELRWQGWESDVVLLTGDRGYFIYPPLWAAGSVVGERSRRDVPMVELWGMQRAIARQLASLPDGQAVRIKVLGE